MVKTHFLLENLNIRASLGILETFQLSSAVLKRKYNCAVLFFSQSYCLFIYVSKIFSHRPPLYNLEFSDVLEKTEFTELPAGCDKDDPIHSDLNLCLISLRLETTVRCKCII